eukprot:Phypoly_transcript_01447.p1 GENE.Phypoly_transcript_01447~~Phypoly_transcript_01447.p1  ORF type:complete len:832 (+),score=84.31 Phypoly_transcript_01447:280-2496(+)
MTDVERRESVVLESVDATSSTNVELCDILPAEDSKSSLLSPSWHPGLLPGETKFMYQPGVAMELTSSVQATWLNNVAYVNNETITPKKTGVLIGTNFRLIFMDNLEKPHKFPKKKPINLIPLGAIGNISFLITGKDESTSKTLQLWCKDWRLITLTFETPATCSEIHKRLIERTVTPVENVFAFSLDPSPSDTIHIMELEFERLKLDPDKWRISTFNHDYSKIPTYPAKLIVPKAIPDTVLQKSKEFRCNSRIPAVCWASPNGVSISRTSQPHTGIWSARSEDDEVLVRGIFANNVHYSKRVMCILDCRPKLSAVGNMAKGLGYEKPEGYSEYGCEITWLGIDNIHAMRDSLRNMYKLCLGSQSDHKWLSNLEYTRWMEHLNLVLSSSVKIVELVQQGSSVLVHCSDGWDRTPQVTSLAQLLLDGYYRTVEGFLRLITKEWLSFGHQFLLRTGHGCSDFWNNEHCSPVFLQWVDCVWQVIHQFPHCFEFNEAFLIDILDNLYNCYFHEFLFNSEKEMRHAGSRQSLWERYMQKSHIFLNPFYAETNDPQVLIPDFSPKRLRFWAGYYLRYYQPMEDGMVYIHQKGKQLQSECSILTEELNKMKLRLDQEVRLRTQLEAQLHALMNANERQKDEMRRRSLECKVMSEEGEGTVFCKIGAEEMGNPQALKRVHIIEDYEPENPPNGHPIEISYQNQTPPAIALDLDLREPNAEMVAPDLDPAHQHVSRRDFSEQTSSAPA